MAHRADSGRLELPRELDHANAWLVPATGQALRIWNRLGLELGEAAVYTDGHELADLVGLIALWHGAQPVVRVTSSTVPAPDGVDTVDIRDAEAAVERLRSLTASAAGFAVVDLSGSGSAVGILLEALPRWGRFALAGPTPEPFTTAFYTDVHRKGALVCGVGDLDAIFTDPTGWQLEIRNACRLLMDERRAAQIRACVTRGLAAVESGAGV